MFGIAILFRFYFLDVLHILFLHLIVLDYNDSALRHQLLITHLILIDVVLAPYNNDLISYLYTLKILNVLVIFL